GGRRPGGADPAPPAEGGDAGRRGFAGDGGVAGVRGFPGGNALVRPADGREPPSATAGLVAARRDAPAGASRAVGEWHRLRRPTRRPGRTGRRVAAGVGGVTERPGGADGA